LRKEKCRVKKVIIIESEFVKKFSMLLSVLRVRVLNLKLNQSNDLFEIYILTNGSVLLVASYYSVNNVEIDDVISLNWTIKYTTW